MRHLRNNSRYLVSGGIWARLRILGLLLTGVVTNLLLLLPLPLLGAVAVATVKRTGFWGRAWDGVTGTPVNSVGAMLRFWEHLGPPDPLRSPALALVFVDRVGAGPSMVPAAAMTRVAAGAAPLSWRARLETFWRTATILAGSLARPAVSSTFCPRGSAGSIIWGRPWKQRGARRAFKGWEKVAAIGGFWRRWRSGRWPRV